MTAASPPISARSGSIIVEESSTGLRIGTVHGNHRPDHVERADILDLYKALGAAIAQARSLPSYGGHLQPEPPSYGEHPPTVPCPRACGGVLRSDGRNSDRTLTSLSCPTCGCTFRAEDATS